MYPETKILPGETTSFNAFAFAVVHRVSTAGPKPGERYLSGTDKDRQAKGFPGCFFEAAAKPLSHMARSGVEPYHGGLLYQPPTNLPLESPQTSSVASSFYGSLGAVHPAFSSYQRMFFHVFMARLRYLLSETQPSAPHRTDKFHFTMERAREEDIKSLHENLIHQLELAIHNDILLPVTPTQIGILAQAHNLVLESADPLSISEVCYCFSTPTYASCPGGLRLPPDAKICMSHR
ncbi:hypothetical protein K440DRAFT_662421 [Wilcoxina mikolae CBS 423.85]|nr:hypothetical protein K440DRAFT_662421 [Wilcoxina mikolae CBS 423.85]